MYPLVTVSLSKMSGLSMAYDVQPTNEPFKYKQSDAEKKTKSTRLNDGDSRFRIEID